MTGIDMCPSQRSQDVTVLISNMETVMGPTPPGTGVMWDALAAIAFEIDVAHKPAVLEPVDTDIDHDRPCAHRLR